MESSDQAVKKKYIRFLFSFSDEFISSWFVFVRALFSKEGESLYIPLLDFILVSSVAAFSASTFSSVPFGTVLCVINMASLPLSH